MMLMDIWQVIVFLFFATMFRRELEAMRVERPFYERPRYLQVNRQFLDDYSAQYQCSDCIQRWSHSFHGLKLNRSQVIVSFIVQCCKTGLIVWQIAMASYQSSFIRYPCQTWEQPLITFHNNYSHSHKYSCRNISGCRWIFHEPKFAKYVIHRSQALNISHVQEVAIFGPWTSTGMEVFGTIRCQTSKTTADWIRTLKLRANWQGQFTLVASGDTIASLLIGIGLAPPSVIVRASKKWWCYGRARLVFATTSRPPPSSSCFPQHFTNFASTFC